MATIRIRKSSERWSDEDVSARLAIYSEDGIQQLLLKAVSNCKMYQCCSVKLADMGIFHSAHSCRDKIKKLKQDYKQIKDHNNKSGNGRKTHKWYDRLDALLGHSVRICSTSSFFSPSVFVCLPGWAWLTYFLIPANSPPLLLFISLIATTHLHLLKTLVPILRLRQFFVYSSVVNYRPGLLAFILVTFLMLLVRGYSFLTLLLSCSRSTHLPLCLPRPASDSSSEFPPCFHAHQLILTTFASSGFPALLVGVSSVLPCTPAHPDYIRQLWISGSPRRCSLRASPHLRFPLVYPAPLLPSLSSSLHLACAVVK
ncbi:hypothetical protein OYC64_003401 [Pagothenia borchgrevinki]|uniref:Myb/SANT-like DNA-binding domain-containing protein n=1 Tax=Pagothenia borchgrevinki TaxID=8213 RepID=A0ABD2FPU9_PAGBO